jgi:hypothetical protein
MGGENGLIGIGNPLYHGFKAGGILVRHVVADSIWNVDGGCTSFNGSFDNPA